MFCDEYALSVKANTDEWLKGIHYGDISGLIKMPLSRHWIMHISVYKGEILCYIVLQQLC